MTEAGKHEEQQSVVPPPRGRVRLTRRPVGPRLPSLLLSLLSVVSGGRRVTPVRRAS